MEHIQRVEEPTLVSGSWVQNRDFNVGKTQLRFWQFVLIFSDLIFIYFFLYYCAVWRYIVAFTKILRMYQL
jgi:hypothetical protein